MINLAVRVGCPITPLVCAAASVARAQHAAGCLGLSAAPAVLPSLEERSRQGVARQGVARQGVFGQGVFGQGVFGQGVVIGGLS